MTSSDHASTSTNSHRCLDDEQVVQLAAGLLPAEQADVLLHDVEGCPDCCTALAEAGVALRGNRPSSHADVALEPGAVIAARYEVVRFIGRGGMGEVYEVFDRQLSELVALKMIRAEFSDDARVIGRFKQELRLARRVVHPNVCRVFDLGAYEAPGAPLTYFHTMDLVNGAPLSKWRTRGTISLPDVLTIAHQLAAGLAAIHAQGIIHRDFKPDNIMVSGENQLRAVILDFGVARPLERINGLVTTALGVRLGTPDYMAPEQLAGKSSSTASDVFSFGLVIYELLTGVHPCPHRGTRTVLGALDELRITPPQRHRAETPADFAQLVLECLCSDALHRPPTGAVLVQRLTELSTATPRRPLGKILSRWLGGRFTTPRSATRDK